MNSLRPRLFGDLFGCVEKQEATHRQVLWAYKRTPVRKHLLRLFVVSCADTLGACPKPAAVQGGRDGDLSWFFTNSRESMDPPQILILFILFCEKSYSGSFGSNTKMFAFVYSFLVFVSKLIFLFHMCFCNRVMLTRVDFMNTVCAAGKKILEKNSI